MGTATSPGSEILEGEPRNQETTKSEATGRQTTGIETKTGAAEHNGRNGMTGREPGRLLMMQLGRPGPAANMANDLLTQPNTESQAASLSDVKGLDALLGRAFEEKPIWQDLYENLRDFFFPVRLPPLELTSTPIPVPDRMAVKANPLAIGISSLFYIALLAILLFFGGKKIIEQVKATTNVTPIDVGDFKLQGPKGPQAGGGGGGGDHDILNASKGKLPPRMKDPITPPAVKLLDNPKLAVPAAINVQADLKLPDNPALPNLGLTTSASVVLSNGQGGGGGIGSGNGGGIGSGNGNGYGPGSGGNAGGGLYHVGGGISAPVALNDVEAEFSDEARRAKYQGVVLVGLIVDAQGNPQNIHIVRALGMGLDEKAIEAIRKYKFKPAMKDGKIPVPVPITIEVNFRLY
jgi:TonB family protein